MRKSLIVTYLLAVVLISGVFFSLAAAQDDATQPDPTLLPDHAQTEFFDNSTVTPDGDAVLYTIMDESSTAPQDDPSPDVPGAEDANLASAQTTADNTLPIVAGAIFATVVACVLGAIVWRRKFAKT